MQHANFRSLILTLNEFFPGNIQFNMKILFSVLSLLSVSMEIGVECIK